MKIKKLPCFKPALLAAGLLLGRGAQADTVLTCDALPSGQASNAQVSQAFGDNAGSSSAGISVTSGGTPNVALTWRAFGGSGSPRWDYYIGGVWSAVQLNDCYVGNYYDLVVTPRGSTKVVINSFNFHGYYADNERFTFGMEIWDGSTLLTNWTTSFLSDGTDNHPVTVNFTGETGHELVLSFNRNSSTLGGGEVEGDAANIAVDDISIGQIAVAEPAGPNSDEYKKYVLRDNPLAYYRLTESTAPADTAVNSGTFGSGGNGQYRFGALHPVPGALGGSSDGAASFNGSSGGTVIPYSATLNPQGPFTVEAWVKPDRVPDSAGTPCPASSAQFSGNRSGWQIRERDTGYQFVLYNNVGSGTAANVLGGGTPSTNSWTHLVGVYDGTNAYIYANGTLANSSSAAGFVANDNAGGTGPFTVGFRSSLDNYFDGAVDEVAIYTNALTSGQILAHYQNGTNVAPGTPYSTLILSANPIEYLRLDEGPVAVNYGSLGSVANGTYAHTANGVLGPQPPAFLGLEATNRGTGFDGYTSYINLGNPAGLNFTGQISLEAWVKAATVQGAFGNIIAHGVNFAGDAEVMLRITDNNRYTLQSWNGTSAGVEYSLPGEDTTGMNWVHLVGTYDGTNWNLFRNGNLVATAANAQGSLLVSDADWAIGASGDPTFNYGFRGFGGAIDEPAIYNYALSPSQVLTHYVAGTNGSLLTLTPSGTNVVLTYPIGTLQQATNAAGIYSDVVATSPQTNSTAGPEKFYRVRF